jgi:RhtB (resistance to homoserine/threonine) family protein
VTLPWVEIGGVMLAHALSVASPGPDFALVLRQGLACGRRAAIWTSLGIGSGILVHSAYTVIGLGVVLKSSTVAFTLLKLAGAAYLGWLGVDALRTAGRVADPVDGKVGADREPSASEAWRRGFFTNVLNPKAMVFFVALFPALVSAGTPRWLMAGYGLWMAVATAAWFMLVATAFTRESVRGVYLRASGWIDRALGVVFIAFAAGVLFTARV